MPLLVIVFCLPPPQLSCTNFSDGLAYHSLLDHLYANFQQFKSHEDIENRYILDTLLSRLPTTSQTHLHNDLHSDNRFVNRGGREGGREGGW